MFDPPPGYGDMIGDAEDANLPEPRFRDLFVEEVGWVRAAKPLPTAVPTLAMAGRTKATENDRIEYLVRFVQDHIGEDELERIMFEQIVGEAPEDAVGRIARALTTWGTERPYTAVVTLAVMAAHHWRLLRLEFVIAGIDRPMELPTMHVLLDRIEKIILESMQTDKPKQDVARRKAFLDKLYRPEPVRGGEKATSITAVKKLTARERRELREAALAEAPAGFDTENVEAAFDAFTTSAR